MLLLDLLVRTGACWRWLNLFLLRLLFRRYRRSNGLPCAQADEVSRKSRCISKLSLDDCIQAFQKQSPAGENVDLGVLWRAEESNSSSASNEVRHRGVVNVRAASGDGPAGVDESERNLTVHVWREDYGCCLYNGWLKNLRD